MICSRQAWSITYVSWLTFVFLIWSCALWMVRDRRRYAMLSSPFMVAYGNLLIVLQYIWTFENMKPISGFFVKKNNPFHSLSSKVWKSKNEQPNHFLDFCFYYKSMHRHQNWLLDWVTTTWIQNTTKWWENDLACARISEATLYAVGAIYLLDSETKHCHTVSL